MYKIARTALISLSIWSTALVTPHAELRPMSENELENTSGQALADIVELVDPSQGTAGYRFLRIRTGATININANIDRVVLGNYYRNDPYVAQFCNAPGVFECPLIGDRTVQHGDYVNHPDASGTTAGTRNTSSGTPRGGYPSALTPNDFVTQDSGSGNWFIDVPYADVILENVSLGAVVGSQLQPLTMENPFFEFVFDESNDALIGLRTGAESQTGHLGNASTGGSCVFDDTRCGGAVSFSGNLNLDVSLANSIMFEIARANFSPTVGFGAFIAGTAPGQTLGDIFHQDTREFYLSLQTTPITYPTISGDISRQQVPDLSNNSRVPQAIPGFALNISDGISAAPFDAIDGINKVSNCFNGSLGPC